LPERQKFILGHSGALQGEGKKEDELANERFFISQANRKILSFALSFDIK
jgi:hypothetical protein